MDANKILFITLSNLGDAVLSLPLIDCLRARFPAAQLTVMVGPRAKAACERNPAINRLIIYDKHVRLRDKARLFFELSREKFDVVIDLRNSLYGALLPARRRTSPFLRIPRECRHMLQRNLFRLYRALGETIPVPGGSPSFLFSPEERASVEALLAQRGIRPGARYVVVNAGANGPAKQWETGRFIEVCRGLSARYAVLLTGSDTHKEIAGAIARGCPSGVYDLSGATSFRQLACLLKGAAAVVTMDTGICHVASYVNAPVVALFGDSDERRYGPWSDKTIVVKKQLTCRPCTKGSCRFNTLQCMKEITVSDVLRAVETILKES